MGQHAPGGAWTCYLVQRVAKALLDCTQGYRQETAR